MTSRIEQFFLNKDIYGYVIGVHYKGLGAFKTRLGAFLTLATYVLMIVNLLTLLQAFQDGSLQTETQQVTKIDRFNAEDIVLSENSVKLMYAVFPPIPDNIGKVVAN